MTVLLNPYRYASGGGGGPAPTDALGLLVDEDNPALWWRMNDLAGSAVALDASGFGRNGAHAGTAPAAAPGSPSLVADGFGGSADYGGNDWTTIAAASWMENNEFTVLCIAELDTVSGHRYLVGRDNAQSATTNRHWGLRMDGNIFRSAYWDSVLSGSGGDRSTGFTGLVTGKKYMFGMQVSAAGLLQRTFLNGREGSSFSLTGPVKSHATAQPLEVGAYNNLGARGFFLDGRVSEVMYFPTAIGRDRITRYQAARMTEAGDSILHEDTFVTGAPGAGWTRVGVTAGAESSVADGMQTTVTGGQAYLRPLPAGLAAADSFEVELQVDLATAASMTGPVIVEAGAFSGVGATQYSSPSGILVTNIAAGAYSGSFQAAGAAMDPVRLRLRKVGNLYTASQSSDGGVTWVTTATLDGSFFTPGRVGFGSWLTGQQIVVTDFLVRKL